MLEPAYEPKTQTLESKLADAYTNPLLSRVPPQGL